MKSKTKNFIEMLCIIGLTMIVMQNVSKELNSTNQTYGLIFRIVVIAIPSSFLIWEQYKSYKYMKLLKTTIIDERKRMKERLINNLKSLNTDLNDEQIFDLVEKAYNK